MRLCLTVVCMLCVCRAALLVEPNGNYLLVKDLEGQVKLEAKARDAQHVKSFLGTFVGERLHLAL